MTVHLAKPAANDPLAGSGDDAVRLTCALVNNMPDGAFDATERQYLGLLEHGSGPLSIEITRYAMPGVPRGEQTSARISKEYLPFGDIYLESPDLLIVTGSNPLETRIQDEIYWPDLVQLLSWAREHVRSTLLSCLSAHAALTVFDGIERTRLPAKCTGVFRQQVDFAQSLGAGIESEILLPHSRWNTVHREDLERAGYDIVVHSPATDWGLASREENGHQLVLVQGHPEYDSSGLLREYRRDAGRYVRHESDNLPPLPYHCVSPDDWDQLDRMHHKIVEGERSAALIDHYPFEEVGARAPWAWRPMAQRLYANWLTGVAREKE